MRTHAETATVLFTDLVDSTGLRQRLGEEAADALDTVHHALLHRAVEPAGGTVVKTLGDGIMAVFPSAADAVGAAVAIQQAAERHGRQAPKQPLAIRAGLSAGDVTERDGDVFGTAVVEASRLCDTAQGGQIIAADLVRVLARGRGGFRFEPMGSLELKGLDEPVPACSVTWEPAEDLAAEVLPFPHLLAPPTGVAYTGRAGLLADLHAAWDRVHAGEGSRLVLLVGEPGVGKTRTSSEMARAAHEAGTPVLYGRCDEALALSYQPYVEALDWQTTHDPSAPLGRFAGDLRRLLPDLGDRVAGLPPAMTSDAKAEEHRLFEATASWLADASRDRGLVLVVDDLHWATGPTLHLLLHVARSAMADPAARLLVLGTYRDTDVDRAHPLSRVLADLRRLPNVDRLPVEPLSEAEVLALVEAAAGHDLDDTTRELARRAYAETEGNPFFVGEVLRHFIEVGAVRFDDGRWTVTSLDGVDVPEGVRDVVGRRLDRLSEQADAVLTAGAIVGREFTVDVVARVADLDVDVVLDVLDEALRARLVEELTSERFRFSHALTRQTLVEEVTSTRRRRLHRKVVAALERLHPDDLAALSHHAVEAGPVGGDLSRAIGYTLAAGEQVLDRAAADALQYFERVLELVEEADDVPVAQVLQARCGVGEAQRDIGDVAHHATLLAVTDDALAAGEIELAVRSTVANARVIMSVVGGIDHDRIAQLEAVLATLGDDPRPERALMLAQLAAELSGVPSTADRRAALAEQALDLLGPGTDPGLETRVRIAAGNALTTPPRLAEMEAFSRAYLEPAERSGDPNLRTTAQVQRAWFLLHEGRTGHARAAIEQARAIAREEGSPTTRWIAESFAAQLPAWDGDVAASRAANFAAFELGQANGEPDALGWWTAIEGPTQWAEGRLEDSVDAARTLVGQFPESLVYRAYLGACLALAGDHDEAATFLAEHGLLSPEPVEGEMFATLCWYLQALAFREIGAASAARSLARAVEPHRDRWACSGLWPFGPIRILLAMCHETAGDLTRARVHADAGWRQVLDSGVRMIVPIVAVDVGRILATADTTTDTDAREVLAHGLAEARAMGMDHLVADLTGLLEGLADDRDRGVVG